MNENVGSVHIAEDVVASVAALAATEVEGVASLAAGVDISDLIGRKHLSRGVKLVTDGSSVTVDVYMIVKYGVKMQETARSVQENVASAIDSMTGMTAAAVNVHISGVAFEKVKK